MITAAKMSVALTALAGIMAMANFKFKIKAVFTPFFACTFVISVMMCAGMLNILNEAAVLLYIFGAALLFYYFFRVVLKKEKLNLDFVRRAAAFAVLALLCMVFFKDKIFHISDEYSHWGTVMKEMCSVGGLPDARTVINYKEYPPAMGLFGYFFMSFTGFSQPICYMAQGIFTGRCVICLFFCLDIKKPYTVVLSLLFAAAALSACGTVVTSLLVDGLIPLVAVAAVLFVLEQGKDWGENPLNCAVLSLPGVITLCTVKTNGVVLYIPILAIAAYLIFSHVKESKNKPDKKTLGLLSLAGGAPFIVLFFWKKYIDKVYLGDGYDTVKFALTKENFMKNFSEKPARLVENIRRDLAANAFSGFYFAIILAALWAAAVILILYRRSKAETKPLKTAFICMFCAVSFWFVYLLGYGLMLVFLMPKWEFDSYGFTMIEFDRYMGVAAGFAFGLLGGLALKFVCQNPDKIKRYMGRGIAGAAFVFACLIAPERFEKMTAYNLPSEYRHLYRLEAQIPKLFTRRDGLMFYTGSYRDDSSYYHNFELSNIFLNRNVANFGHETVEGYDYLPGDGKLSDFISEKQWLIKIFDDEEFVRIMQAENITVDDNSGILYSIEYDKKSGEINLVKQA